VENNEEQLVKLNNNLKSLTSYPHTFFRGILQGIGTAIGATIIAGVLIGVIAAIVNSSDEIPIINTIIEKTNLKEIINQN